jgi:hypothetical protein
MRDTITEETDDKNIKYDTKREESLESNQEYDTKIDAGNE